MSQNIVTDLIEKSSEYCKDWKMFLSSDRDPLDSIRNAIKQFIPSPYADFYTNPSQSGVGFPCVCPNFASVNHRIYLMTSSDEMRFFASIPVELSSTVPNRATCDEEVLHAIYISYTKDSALCKYSLEMILEAKLNSLKATGQNLIAVDASFFN